MRKSVFTSALFSIKTSAPINVFIGCWRLAEDDTSFVCGVFCMVLEGDCLGGYVRLDPLGRE